jgi:DNA topoisomerase-1
MKLVIVESPTKAKTIKNFLSSRYKIVSSYGHVRDLPKTKFGIDVEKDFKPKYLVLPKARKNVKLLKKEVKKADSVSLATDEDREGEAIAWHLIKALGLKDYKRITFHEITKKAIQEALKNPRDIDINLVDAQQARRILDRIVGYRLSPFLWKKVARGLSAGRVQSVVVKLVVKREKEIKDFVPQEHWKITATLLKPKTKEFDALLTKKEGKTIPKLGIKTKKEAGKMVRDLKGAEYQVVSVKRKELKRNPLPPFTTSTLQQEAWKRFRWSAKRTMRAAQVLYEKGFITYHRSDSFNLSNLALFGAKKWILKKYGKNYWAGFLRKYKTKGRVQEAHEAIRPTYANKTPESLTNLEKNQLKLYDLIWRRFVACQMAQAVFDTTTVDIKAKDYIFRVKGQVLKFDGFLKVYPIRYQENELPELKKNDILKLIKLTPSQHFTQPPPRYTEATLIKTLEENGIGRPSTYAPVLSTVQERNYIEKNEKKRFQPTEIGTVVNNLLVNHFPKIVDINFTAKMEEDLDKIAKGKRKWVPVVKDFFNPFEKNLKQKEKEVSKKDITEKPTDKICPKCGSPMIIRLGRYGKFYACSAFPKCKHTEPLEKEILGIKCPGCKKGEIVPKRTKRRTIFYGCNQYPECKFALWDKPTGEKCPECGALLIKKRGQIQCSNKECNFKKPVDEKDKN